MIRNKGNTYNKVLRHLKSTQIDEKIQLLSEVPTNSTSGIYVIEPESIVQDPDETVLEGEADFTQDALADGRDTTGLFLEDGTILTIEPPDALGNKSFILGPMASMWYAWGNFSTIGYIRQSDRRMVDLGRITGQLGSWNGSSNFTSYGQLTLAQAVWFRDTPKLNGANNNTPNYRAFYPGPPSNAPDQYGRYYCVITGTPKPTTRTPPPRRVPPVVGNPNQAGYPSWGNTRGKGGGSKGSKGGGPKTPGPKKPGPKTPGPKTPGPKTPGPKKPGPKTPGPKTQQQSNPNINPNIIPRVVRSLTDPLRYSGGNMYQGNPNTRAPGLSNYWSPDPKTAGTYARTGDLKGTPGFRPDPKTGTFTTAPRPDNIPQVSRSPLGQPQFKFPEGSPPPKNMITQVADDIAVDAAAKVASKATNVLGRAVPVLSLGVATADAVNRANNGDYIGAVLSGVSAVPGPIGWGGLAVQIATDLSGFTGGKYNNRNESFDNYQDYLNKSKEIFKQKNLPIDQNAYLSNFLRLFANDKNISDNDKAMFVAIIQGNVKNITKNDIVDFVKRLQKVLSNFNDINEYIDISESRQRILRDIKKPYVLPEIPKQKYKINLSHNNRNINPDLMKKAEVPTSFKPAEEKLWGKYEKDKNSRMSQERKNEVLDHLGGSDHAWEYMTETSREKNNKIMYGNFDNKKELKVVRKEELKGDTLLFILDETNKKESILQSELSIHIANEYNKELFQKYFQEQETMQADKDPLFKRVSKRLKKEIDYPDKPAKNGYPNDSPPKMVNGMHPEYGKDKGYYNKLDPQSAKAMPPTGTPEIDQKVRAARKIKDKYLY